MVKEVEEKQLADRFSNYGDAIVAISFVNALAFFIAILDHDVLCSLIDHRVTVILFSVILQAAYLVAILVFRLAEVNLRQSAGDTSSLLVTSYLGRLHVARVAFVVLVTVTFAIVAWHSIVDPTCTL